MQTYPRIMLPKLVHLQCSEYSWVTNILTVARSDFNFKKAIMNWKPGTVPNSQITNQRLIMENGHSGGTLCWAIEMSKIRKHKLGYGYNPVKC